MAENGEAALIAAVASSLRTVVDVGANIGDWTATVLIRAPDCRAVLFDPSRSAIAALHQRFRGVPHVEVLELGLADAPGTLTFFEEPAAGKTSSFQEGLCRLDAEPRSVAVSTLDTEVQRLGINHIDFLKIDAEGFDMRVLRGAAGLFAAGRVRVVQFEYNYSWALGGGTLGEAVAFFARHGYTLFAAKSTGLYSFEYGDFGEFFGYANFVAVSRSALPLIEGLMRGLLR